MVFPGQPAVDRREHRIPRPGALPVGPALGSAGAVARRFPYNYQQGLRYSVPYEGLPGAVWCGERVTEQNQLIWLKRWAEFMEARDWDQLMRRAPVSNDVAFPLKIVR